MFGRVEKRLGTNDELENVDFPESIEVWYALVVRVNSLFKKNLHLQSSETIPEWLNEHQLLTHVAFQHRNTSFLKISLEIHTFGRSSYSCEKGWNGSQKKEKNSHTTRIPNSKIISRKTTKFHYPDL